jgi:putative flippase GtrA
VLSLIKYSSVATASAVVDWAVFVTLDLLRVPAIVALICARLAGGAFSFGANRSWSFSAPKPNHVTVQGRRFLLLYALSFGLAVGLFWSLVHVVGLAAYPSKLVTDTTCFFLNYTVMKTYVFHGRPGITRLFQAVIRRGRNRRRTTPASSRSSR